MLFSQHFLMEILKHKEKFHFLNENIYQVIFWVLFIIIIII